MSNDHRYMILAATPLQVVELKTIFSDGPESIRRKLENPPAIRAAGWDLPRQTQAEFIAGELIRVIESDRSTVDLYRDGTFIVKSKIHRNFLAWSDKTDSTFHSLALIEFVLNFAQFYQLVLRDFVAEPEQIQLRIELHNMHLAGQPSQLGTGPVGQFGQSGPFKEAPKDQWAKEVACSCRVYNSERIAFMLIRELYVWFGHAEESIPYTKNENGVKSIASDEIAQIH